MSKEIIKPTHAPNSRALVFNTISPAIEYYDNQIMQAEFEYNGSWSAAAFYKREELIRAGNIAYKFLPEIVAFSKKYDVDLKWWPVDVPTPDTLPGSNRFAIFPELMTRDTEGAILADYCPGVKTPNYNTARRQLEAPEDIDVPYVLKDVLINRGINKFFVEKLEDHEKVMAFLKTVPAGTLSYILLEEYINTPSVYGTSFRVTTTATGHIQAATLNRSARPIHMDPVDCNDFTETWRPLADPASKYFIAPKKIASNIVRGGKIIPLAAGDYTGPKRDLRREDEAILMQHGIHKRTLPANIAELARVASKALGPSLGIQLGVDILVDRNLDPYLLEINNSPSPEPVRASWGESFTHKDIFLSAAERFFHDLSTIGQGS